MEEFNAVRQQVSAAIKHRRDSGETLEQIAADLGVHWVTVWKWEQGQVRDSTCALVRLISSPVPNSSTLVAA